MRFIKRVVLFIIAFIMGLYCAIKVLFKPTIKELSSARALSAKHFSMFLLMDRWVFLKQKKKCLDKFFYENGYHTIAIYGVNYIGNALIEELKGTSIIVRYGIDRAQINREDGLKVMNPESNLDNVDVVIVTPVNSFEQIADDISKKIDCPIVSIEEVISYCGQ